MAILAVDEVMLREPRLLVPRMVPVGNIILNKAHKLVPNYRCLIATSILRELVNNANGYSNDAPIFGAGVPGRSLSFTSQKTTGLAAGYFLYPTTASLFTALAFVSSDTTDAIRACYYQSSGVISIYNGGGSLTNNIYEVHFGVNASAQWTFCSQFGTTTGTDSSSAGGTVIAKRANVLVATVTDTDPGTNSLYVNGHLVGSNSLTDRTASATATITRLADVGYVTAARYWVGDLFAFMCWNYVLTPAQIAAISADPFQVLTPA